MNDDGFWVGKRQGRLNIKAIIRPSTQGRSALYRARCDCGNYIAISRTTLSEGADSCGCEGSQMSAGGSDIIHSYPGCNLFPENVVLCYSALASYCPGWWATSLKTAVDGICNMLARDEYSQQYVADWWGCPVEFVLCVEQSLGAKIRTLRKELTEMRRLYENIIDQRTTSELSGSSYDGIRSLIGALSSHSRAGRYSRREAAE